MVKPRQHLFSFVPDVLSVGLILGALGALWRFFLVDQRPPMDLGHYFDALPDAWRAWGELDLQGLVDLALHAGGLYNLALGLLARVLGRSPALIECVEVFWLALLLFAMWGCARRLGGPWAGTVTLALAAAMPVMHTGARSHWIHFPEAALLMVALWFWVRDPTLEGRLSRVGLCAALALGFCLRPTALLFGLPLLALAGSMAQPRSRIFLPASSLLAALLVLLPSLPEYIQGKSVIREVYAEVVAPLGPSLLEHSYLLPGGAVLLGVALLPLVARSRLRERPLWLLATWVTMGLCLCAFFHVGPDNFPLMFLGAAMVAAQGLAMPGSAGWRRWAKPAAGLSLVALAALSMVTPFLLEQYAMPFTGVLGRKVVSLEPRHYQRPQVQAVTLDAIRPLLDQVCKWSDDTCTVLASRGLVNFNREDDLSLACFLDGRDDLVLHNAGQFFFLTDIESDDAVEGLMVLECPHAAPEPDNLFTERERALEAMVAALDVSFIQRLYAPLRCSFNVYRVDEPDPQQALEDFWLEYPWVHSGPKSRPAKGHPQRR